VIERASGPGGRVGLSEANGFRFDTGATVFTMPDILADCFAALGTEMHHHVTIRPVDPMYRACFEDGSVLRVWHGRERMAEEIRQLCGPGEAAAFERFCAWLQRLYDLEMANFIARNFASPLDLVRPLEPALRLVAMGGFRKLSKKVAGFFSDERLRRIFSFQSMYAGLAPYEALAIYCVITYMDAVAGVYVPEGGMNAIGRGLAEAAEKNGVTFRYDETVETVVRRSGSTGPVTGVRLAGGEALGADAVVVNTDLPVAYRYLLGGLDAPRRARRGRYSPSCLVWNAGVTGRPPPGTAHHNIHFVAGWEKGFRAILDDGVRMASPSILVTFPSLCDSSLAPEGAHTRYVLEPVPNLDGRVDWTIERPLAHEQLERLVASLGYTGDVVVEELVDPLDWEHMGMERGTPFALSHRFFQTGPFRPANVDHRAPGLVFVGSGTVPGVGVPMVLVSGRLAADRVDQMTGVDDARGIGFLPPSAR